VRNNLQGKTLRKDQDVLELFAAYRAEHGHVSPSIREEFNGEKIGILASCIRSKKQFPNTHPKLIKMGFVMDIKQAKAEEILELFKAYKAEHGHLKFKLRETYEGEKIGVIAQSIRLSGNYECIHAELIKIGFVMDLKAEKLKNEIALFQAYKNQYGHLNVERNEVFMGEKIGALAHSVRTPGIKMELTEELLKMGFVMDMEAYRLEQLLELCKAYKAEYGHINPKQKETYRGKKIGQSLSTVRAKGGHKAIHAELLELTTLNAS